MLAAQKLVKSKPALTQIHILPNLSSLATQTLKDNIFTEGKDCNYTAASGKMLLDGESQPRFLYPFQWLWDTFFIAGWSSNTDQSVVDVTKFLASQTDDGFMGHIRYNREILARKEYFPPPEVYYEKEGLPQTGEVISKITQPPNAGYGLLELVKRLPESTEKTLFAKYSFDKVYLYHKYIYENLVRDGLFVTTHPWESGDDNSPKWDGIYNRIREGQEDMHTFVGEWLGKMGIAYERVDIKLIHHTQRPVHPDYDIYLYLIYLYNRWNWNRATILEKSPFRVTDPMTNSILIRSNLALIELAETLNESQEIIEQLKRWAEITTMELDSLWDKQEKIYFAKDLVTGELIKIKTVSGLMPLFSTVIPQENADQLAHHIDLITKSGLVRYIVPSTFPSETSCFEPDRYWRGPVWIITNELVAEGLNHYGYKDCADKIRMDNLELISNTLNDRGGFYEYYNPINGKGLGSPLQSWTAAAVLKMITTP